jgi:hypothetical protein
VRRALTVGFALATVAGCGGTPHVGPATGPSCSGKNNGVTFCLEAVNGGAVDVTSFQNQCAQQLGGTFSTQPCNRMGVVGGCEQTVMGVSVVDWFYSDTATVSAVQQACEQNKLTFVLP